MSILTPSIAAQRTERQLLHSMEPEPFVTPVEAAAFLRCAPVTVKRLAREGKIPAHSIQNGIRRRYGLLLIRHRSPRRSFGEAQTAPLIPGSGMGTLSLIDRRQQGNAVYS